MFTSLPSSLLLSSLLLATAALPVESTATELRQLTASDFASSIQEGIWFVEYFSPFCGHCRNFAPTWKRLVEHVESQDQPGISLAQVNCVTEGDLCHDNKVRGYPSLRLYENGEQLEEYNDDRDLDLLTNYVDEHARKTPASSPLPNPNGAVLPLDKNTFKSTIDEGPAFIKFFAPWCGHCRKLAPTWVQFAAQMKDKVTVAEVNCEDHKALCSMEHIQGYPTIFFYQHGRVLDYTGRRTLEAMEAFADAALAPPLTHISLSDLNPLVDQQEVLYLLVHDKLDPTLQDTIEEASQPLHGLPQIFSIQSSSELLSSLSLPATQSLPVIVSLKDNSLLPFHQLVISTTSPMEQISDWLVTHSLPTSMELSAENFPRVMGPSPVPPNSPSRLVVLAAINTHHSAHINYLKQTASTWHRGEHTGDNRQVAFAWMDSEKWASWLKSVYGVKGSSEPTIVIVDHGRLLYYDSFPSGAHIKLEMSSITAALEGIAGGVLRPKHSENIAERFARWLNGCVLGLQSTIYHHPVRSVLLIGITLVGIFFGVKRMLEEDSRKTSVYSNTKSGSRLD